MINSTEFEIARRVRSRILDDMTALKQAERDVAVCVPSIAGMSFDSAENAYAHALEQLGVPRSETKNIPANALRLVLRNIPRHGAPRLFRRSSAAPGMSFDSHDAGRLSSILASIKPPRDMSQ